MIFFEFDIIIVYDCETGGRQKPCYLPSPPNPLGLRSSGRLLGAHYGEPLARVLRSADKRANRGVGKKSHCCISATARPIDVDVDSFDEDAGNLVQAGVGWFDAFYRFSRPHTIIGSVRRILLIVVKLS